VRRKSKALNAPERLYKKIAKKVAADGTCLLPPNPDIHRTTLRGIMTTQYMAG
jgi:hypothetical protein